MSHEYFNTFILTDILKFIFYNIASYPKHFYMYVLFGTKQDIEYLSTDDCQWQNWYISVCIDIFLNI